MLPLGGEFSDTALLAMYFRNTVRFNTYGPEINSIFVVTVSLELWTHGRNISMPPGRRIVCWRSDTACELNIFQAVYWSPQVARMALNVGCVVCFNNEARSSELTLRLE